MWKSICIKSFLYKKFVGLFEQCNYVEKCLVFSIFNLASKTVLTKFFFHNFCSKRRSFVCIMSYIQSLCIGKLYSLHVWVNEQCNTLRDEWMSGSRPVVDQLLPIFHSNWFNVALCSSKFAGLMYFGCFGILNHPPFKSLFCTTAGWMVWNVKKP